MNELNMSSFIQTMQPGLMTHDGQEAAGVFLLSAINDQEYVGLHGYRTDSLGSKKISRIVSRDDHVPDGIKQASQLPNVIEDTVKYFREVVMPDMKRNSGMMMSHSVNPAQAVWFICCDNQAVPSGYTLQKARITGPMNSSRNMSAPRRISSDASLCFISYKGKKDLLFLQNEKQL